MRTNDKMTVNKKTIDKMTVNKKTVDKITIENRQKKMTVDKMIIYT